EVQFFPDSEGKIWLAIDWCGLDRYDPETGRFEHFNDDIFAVRKFSPRLYWYVIEDSKLNIWIGAQAGLYKYSKKKEEAFSLASGMWHVNLIMEDHEGGIWAANPFMGRMIRKIESPDREDSEWVSFPYIGDSQQLIEFMPFHKVLSPSGKYHRKVFLISFGGHLYRFDVENRAVTPQTDGLAPGELVCALFNDGITLVGTSRNRVLQYDHEKRLFLPFLELPELPGQEDKVGNIFRTDDGLLWVVTKKRTFQVLPPGALFHKINFPDNLRLQVLYGAHESLVAFRGHLYFNTVDGLLPVFEGETVPIPLEFTDEDFGIPPQGPEEKPTSIETLKTISGFKFCEDTLRKRLWLLLYQFPKATKVFGFDENGRKVFEHSCSGWDTCFTDHFGDLDIDPMGRLWMAGWAGAGSFDPETRRFTKFTQAKGLPDRSTRSILYDKQGHIWIGANSGGVARYDTGAGCFDYFSHKPSDANSLSTDYVVGDLLEDHSGAIWIATNNGLNRYDRESNGFEQFHEMDGLPSAKIGGMIEDKNHDIWVNTPTPLVTRYRPAQKAFYTYGRSDGWPEGDYKTNFLYKDGKGRLFFQTTDGLVWFHPDSIGLDTRIPKLCFKELQLANQPVKVNDSTGILTKSLAFTEGITLQYRQNVFTIRYTALEYLHPEKITYAFQLEGFDERFRMAGNTRAATYTNLSPGDYRFLVKCRNRHGFWSDPIAMNITILPPWYRSWWAYGLWTALLLGSLFSLYRYQLNRKLAQAEARRLRELDEVKTRLYTNITHEFRTPLTIIDGMAGQLQAQASQSVKEGLKLIRRNGRQLLSLVNQMLSLARLESDSLPVNMQQSDVIVFLKYLLESYHSLAEAKRISLHFRSEEERLVMDYDAEKLQQILGNLLSNAIKFTDAEGKVEMAVEHCRLPVAGLPNKQRATNNKKQKAGTYLSVSISDTGTGIPQERIARIFSRFYQVDDTATRSREGTGIGLTLAKELVELLSGQIEVESEVGRGTTFRVLLPITKLANTPNEDSLPTPPSPLKWEIHPLFSEKPDHPISSGPMEKVSQKVNTLLIIEDNPDVTHYLSSILKKNYSLLTAADGKAGLEKAQKENPDIILCDVMMPEMDGYEVCRRLKTDIDTSHIPIILLTAKADIDSRIEGLDQGADAYLAKPFEERELRVRLRKLLENRERLRQFYTSEAFINRAAPLPSGQAPSKEQEFLQQLLGIIEAHLSDSSFSADQLSRALFMSYPTCFRKVKAATGMAVGEYIRHIRMHRAARLLLERPELKVQSIALEVGYNSHTYFSREFKKVMGRSPTAYRKG
ncbi:MAG: response regulator, partial [Phaeodactylibacter sp.]|nr:response regulator [Phaeodactylibacter sp.]